MRSAKLPLLTLALLLSLGLAAIAGEVPGVDGYQPMVVPDDNPITPGKVSLGRQLFFDKRLSGDLSTSCASCHIPRYAWTQGPKPAGPAYGKLLRIACPSLVNSGHQTALFWEGAVPSLERAVRGMWMFAMLEKKEGLPTPEDIAERLNALPLYRQAFERELGGPATPDRIAQALATFLRTLNSNGSAWMRFYRGNDPGAMSAAARRGYVLFDGKARCSNCHSGVLLTDLQYHNVGVDSTGPKPNLGRYRVTKNDRDRSAFKTPSLLNIGRTAPYFHDHSVKTLEEAVDQMLGGGLDNPNLDRANLAPVTLTANERKDLLAFLRSLDTNTSVAAPKLP
jgi:cytochrome c peroxidase